MWSHVVTLHTPLLEYPWRNINCSCKCPPMVTDLYRITTACPSLKRHMVIIQMRKSELFFLLADYAFCIASSE